MSEDWSDWSEGETDRISQCTMEQNSDVTDRSSKLEGVQNRNESDGMRSVEQHTGLTDKSSEVENESAENKTESDESPSAEKKMDVPDKSNEVENKSSAENKPESDEVPSVEQNMDLTEKNNEVENESAENRTAGDEALSVEQNTNVTDKFNETENQSAENKNESDELPSVEKNTDVTDKSNEVENKSAENEPESDEVPSVEQNTDLTDNRNEEDNESNGNKTAGDEALSVEQNTNVNDKFNETENQSAKNKNESDELPSVEKNTDLTDKTNEIENESDEAESVKKNTNVTDKSSQIENESAKNKNESDEARSVEQNTDVSDKTNEVENEKNENKAPYVEQNLRSPSFRIYRNCHENKNESDESVDDLETDSLLSTSSAESVRFNISEGITKQKKCRKLKRKTRQKQKYLYSSDDNIPLSILAKRTFIDSDSDKSYDPANEDDMNSTDSEYGDLISKRTHRKRQKERKMKQQWEKLAETIKRKQKRNKQVSSPRKIKKQKASEVIIPQQYKSTPDIDNNELPKDVMVESASAATLHNDLIEKEAEKINKLLREKNLVRDKIEPYGNCFFEASAKQIDMDHAVLRHELCKTLEENMDDYVLFLLNRHHPDDEETFVADYLTEVAKLKEDGYWTSSVADLLPLVLANYTKRTVVLYTNIDDQSTIIITPTINTETSITNENSSIKLVYTSIPNVYEHYDACFSDTQPETFIACPVEFAVQKNNENTPVKKHSPRKKAVYITPPKKVLTRKRKATPENWKKNLRKKLRLSGAEYIGSDGSSKPAKMVKAVDCSKCKYKCSIKVTSEQRHELFRSFWSLGSYERQKDYVCSRVEETPTRTYLDKDGNIKKKRKQVDRQYTFVLGNEKVSVCKPFFSKTLCVGASYIDHALNKKNDGHFVGQDQRGKHIPHNKIPKNTLNHVKRHIESFPKVSGHYVRKETNRQFLGPELTLKIMYDLYEEECKTKDLDPVSLGKYRDIFTKNYNLSFHVPKKDQCLTCNAYHNAIQKGTITTEQQEKYDNHQTRKQRARLEKETDKTKARSEPNVHTACFDLQSVLYTPCSLVSVMYYMRKLCCYNLTFYSLGDSKGTCYIWSELDAKRGASEVGTCIRLHLMSLPTDKSHVILYSDACGGQNRNKIIASCLLHCVRTMPNINIIDHKFLESGHTHMEVDSMHAAVEFAKKKTHIYVPSQWDTVLQMARKKNPYHVTPIKHYDILDFKQYQSITMKAPKKAESGKKVEWNKMKWMRYLKEESEVCYFKYAMDDEFEKIKVSGSRRQQSTIDDSVPAKYASKLPISAAKKKDLVQLCKTGVIPTEYHEYYKSLPSTPFAKEILAEPDMAENSSDDSD